MVDIPMYSDKMVDGLGYNNPAHPTTDAFLPDSSNDSQKPGSPPIPTVAVSIASNTEDLNPLGARQESSLKKDGWLDYLKPHVTTK